MGVHTLALMTGKKRVWMAGGQPVLYDQDAAKGVFNQWQGAGRTAYMGTL